MATTNSSMRKSVSKQPSNVVVRKSSTKKMVKLTPSQLEKLYDKEEKCAERAGNAEERCMRVLSDAIEATKKLSRIQVRLNKVWENTTAKVDGLMKAAATKCKNIKGEARGQLCAEINIASLEKQIEVYYSGIRQIEAILEATQNTL
jgi:hypothetical protein